jgi:hypothetical protein
VERFVNLVYYWATRGYDQEKRENFDAFLSKPSGTGSDAVAQATGAWSRDSELEQFKRSSG